MVKTKTASGFTIGSDVHTCPICHDVLSWRDGTYWCRNCGHGPVDGKHQPVPKGIFKSLAGKRLLEGKRS